MCTRIVIVIALVLSLASCKSSGPKKNNNPSWAILPFTKVDSVNPILVPDTTGIFTDPVLHRSVAWEAKDVFNPAAVVMNDKIYLLYRAEDTIVENPSTSRIGLAVSDDGMHFTSLNDPVFYPGNDTMEKYEWEGGCEDPRIVQREDGLFLMTYTAYDGKIARLCLAVSKNLKDWTKQGLIFGKYKNGKYHNLWSKSGAILVSKVGDRLIACKIHGKYWMYWGDSDIFLATSEDGIQWEPLEENNQLKKILSPRKGYFDSRLVEPGPFALYTDTGIVLIYNSMNHDHLGDPELEPGTYAVGQILLDKNDPSKAIDRMDRYFIKPEKDYEINGQVSRVCFAEGMAPFHGKWFLYYGTADSKIAVAVAPIR